MKTARKEKLSALPYFGPRECRQAGILNLGSDVSRSFRLRRTRHKGHAQQQFQWFATDAN